MFSCSDGPEIVFNSKLVEMDNSSLVTGKKHFKPLESVKTELD